MTSFNEGDRVRTTLINFTGNDWRDPEGTVIFVPRTNKVWNTNPYGDDAVPVTFDCQEDREQFYLIPRDRLVMLQPRKNAILRDFRGWLVCRRCESSCEYAEPSVNDVPFKCGECRTIEDWAK